MKILITGLCFQGNKGGPAIALSLKKQLERVFPDSKLVFSVPGKSYGESFQKEQECAKEYGVDVVENFSQHDYFRHLVGKNSERAKVTDKWLAEFKQADLIVDMTAISYVGPPLGNTKRALIHGRFRYFVLSRIFKKPFLAWTQSYGPFSNSIFRSIAKWDLNSQPIIFCRGLDCQKTVTELLPNAKTRSYPDVAVTLSYKSEDTRDFKLSEYFNEDIKTITVSPSAVLYARSSGSNEANIHLNYLISLTKHLLDNKYRILLVPHLHSQENLGPELCDFALCRQLAEMLTRAGYHTDIVTKDLSPQNLKAIISKAYLHIGARYHSLVASLSAGVPSLALSWHPKYQDIMAQYEFQDYVIEDTSDSQLEQSKQLIGSLITNHDSFREKLVQKQHIMVRQVEENADMLAQCYRLIS